MRQKAGNIINISSIMGLGPFPGAIANAAAKAGVISLTRTSALEWAPYNIRVNAIAPGFIETAIMTKAWNEHPSMMQEDLQYIPLGRMGKPEDIAGAAIFLASPASDKHQTCHASIIFSNYGCCGVIRATGRRSGQDKQARGGFSPNKLI